MKIKYQVGLNILPTGKVVGTAGLIGGREISQVLKLVKLNKKRNTYLLVKFFENQSIAEIWKITKAEYENLHCGFGLTDLDFWEMMARRGIM